ncbi:Transcription factor-like protein DPB [Zea mays]|uniref:Transcription factor-like protein DPB n=1 Tax=Zea mays TaxID=4577 RepID=C0PCD8_MAIZE|nr:Transcription factor-like protein DPB [Zea mays]ACN31833.1 unknown [Zea mays]AQL09611.1 Transcription factor-like protein DPB [Zea mays]|eukprot:NP_001169170.1 Transcription factor-like protein DPB [Zea mays]
MVSGAAHNPGGGAAAQTTQRSPPQLGARTALATPPPVSGGAAHSASTSGGTAGSPPSSRSEQHAPDGAVKGPALGTAPAAAAASTPASDSTFLRLNNLDINGDDAPSSQAPTSKKKRRGTRAVGPDKGNRGLRQFSMKVCEKVESKGRTTYNEVADELVAEFTDPNNNIEAPDPDNPNAQQYDEKNIRRRVYDALNVLMAMDIISKDKKEIQWKGLPRTSISDIEELKTELVGLKGRIEKKSVYLQELQDQYVGLQNLIQRNEQLYGSGNTPSGGVALPFILVQTRPHATVEVEISEDMQLVHFDFNSTPFELHDDSYVLKEMRFCGREQHDGTQESISNGGESSNVSNIYWQQAQRMEMPNNGTVRLSSSPPIPGILKGRVKHEQH